MTRKHKEQNFPIVEVHVESIGLEGVAVGRVDGIVHFVKGALPGETVRAQIKRKKKRHVECEVVEVLSPSEHRIQAPCPHFGTCGGCSWQHLEYAQQVLWKQRNVKDAFKHIGGLENVDVQEAVACDESYGYRNKMEFSFGASRWLTTEEIATGEEFDTRFALGLHVPGRFDKVRHIDHCAIQSEAANKLLAFTHELANKHNVVAYHARAHEGFLRHLVIRTSKTTGDVLSVLITTSPSTDSERSFVSEWLQSNGELTTENGKLTTEDGEHSLREGSSLLHAVNDTHSPVANGVIQQQLGPGFLTETTHGVQYRISPFAFFQTNTRQMSKLVEEALNAAEIASTDVVWDLYCGVGTLTLPAARIAKHVIGIELSAASIGDATSNAELNSITNVEFHAMDLHAGKAIDALHKLTQPDVLIVDPPRSGMHPQVVQHILDVAPRRVSYVSCNPATLARDCGLLSEKYTVDFVVPVDMFPQTFHIEAVARLTLNG